MKDSKKKKLNKEIKKALKDAEEHDFTDEEDIHKQIAELYTGKGYVHILRAMQESDSDDELKQYIEENFLSKLEEKVDHE